MIYPVRSWFGRTVVTADQLTEYRRDGGRAVGRLIMNSIRLLMGYTSTAYL